MPQQRLRTVAVVLALVAFAPAVAADPRPSWECLPNETGIVLRMPQPAEFLAALRSRTKFGAVALSEQRLEGLWSLILKQARAAPGAANLDALDETLAKYDLKQADLPAALGGDLGAGFVFRRRAEGLPPLVTMLVWLEPGAEVATRLVAAAQQRLGEDIENDDTGTTRRIDLELAGHDVLWMVEPVMGIDPDALAIDDLGVDADDEAAVEKRLAELQDRIRNAKLVKTGVTHAFLARLGGRLLVGQTLPATGVAARPAAGGPVDADGGEDIAKEVFERFLAAHDGDGRGPLADMAALPGMAASLPAGLAALDVFVDPRVLLEVFADEGMRGRLEAVGLGGVGPIGWRQTLDGGLFRSGAFVSLAAPRGGLMRILDQDCDASDVPPFVTRDAIDISQISLDLGRAYETVKEFAVAEGGEEAGNLFMAVEMQAQGWLGVEVPRLLSALGTRHWIVSYPPRVAEALAEARMARDGAAQARQVADRVAVVWRIADEEPFARILQRLAGAVGGELQEEQGFRGVRIPDGPAIYVGRDHLVLAVGGDSLEQTLAAIRNPPAGESSLRESDVPRRAAEMLSLEPARMFGISDSSRAGGSLGVLRDMVDALVPEDVEESYREFLAGGQQLLPTSAEMEGMFGVGATTLRGTPEGVSLQTVWEMPAP
jgi:hypothetical protein